MTRDLTAAGACEAADRQEAGEIDVLIANLACENFSGIAVNELERCRLANTAFDMMVHPLHRLTRAVLTADAATASRARSSSSAAQRHYGA